MSARKLKPALYTVSYRDADGCVLTTPQAPYTLSWDPVTQARRFVVLLAPCLYERGRGPERRRLLESTERVFIAMGRRAPLIVPEVVASILVTSTQGYRAEYRIEPLAWVSDPLRMPSELPAHVAESNAAHERGGHGANFYDPSVIDDYAGQTFGAEWAHDPYDHRYRFIRFTEVLPPVSNETDPRPWQEREDRAVEVGKMLARSRWPLTVGIRLCGSNMRYAIAAVAGSRTYPEAQKAQKAPAAAGAGKGRRR